jgi:hypothetical protein
MEDAERRWARSHGNAVVGPLILNPLILNPRWYVHDITLLRIRPIKRFPRAQANPILEVKTWAPISDIISKSSSDCGGGATELRSSAFRGEPRRNPTAVARNGDNRPEPFFVADRSSAKDK